MAIQPEAQTGTKHHFFFYFFSPRSDLILKMTEYHERGLVWNGHTTGFHPSFIIIIHCSWDPWLLWYLRLPQVPMSCFHEWVGVGWWENGDRTGSDNELLLNFFFLFSFWDSQRQCNHYKRSCLQRGLIVLLPSDFFYYGDDGNLHWHLIHYQTTSAGITYLHVSMLLCFRGQDVSAFQPTPDIILVADCIYYEEVRVFMFSVQR